MSIDRNSTDASGRGDHPIAKKVDLCLYRAVAETCRGRIYLPFGVRQVIKDYVFGGDGRMVDRRRARDCVCARSGSHPGYVQTIV